MLPLILYFLSGLLLLAIAHRAVRRFSTRAAAFLILLPFCIAGYALLTNRVLAPVDLPYEFVPMNWLKEPFGVVRASTGLHNDVALEFIPWRRATQESLARGEWGLWNRFTFAGEPLLGGEQAAVLLPTTWIACLLPAALSFTYSGAITLLIAGLTAFLFARELRCREGAALVAAAGWAFAGANVLFLHTAMTGVWSWVPLMFLGVRRVVRIPTIGSAAILTGAFAVILGAGHPESALYSVTAAGLYGIFELVRRRRLRGRAAALAVAGGIVALLLNAVHLLPFFEAVELTHEKAYRETVYRKLTRGVPLPHVAARIVPTFFPYAAARQWRLAAPPAPYFSYASVGSILVGLALYAVWRVRSAHTWFFAFLFAAFVLTGAEWGPLANSLAQLPLYDIALPDRMTTVGAFALCMLAALAAERICRQRRSAGAAWTLAFWLAAVVVGNAYLLRTPLLDHGEVFFGRWVVLAEIAGLAAAIVAPIASRATIPLLLALIVAQRALSVGDIHRSFTPGQTYPPIAVLEPLQRIETPFRIVGHGTALPPATSTMYDLEDIRGYSALTFARLRETYPLWAVEQIVSFNRVDDLTRPFLSFLNVRYGITWDRDPLPPGWREVARQKGSVLLENMNVLPRAFVPAAVRVGDAPQARLQQMSATRDFARIAWIEAGGPPHERANGPGTATMRRARLGWLLDVHMQREGWLVTSTAAWPGWRAVVDGRRVRTHIANHAFLSLHLPAGRHRVRLQYLPDSFVAGASISAATAALIALLAAAAALRRRHAA